MRVSLFSAAANKPCGGLKMKPFVTGIHLEQNQPQFDCSPWTSNWSLMWKIEAFLYEPFSFNIIRYVYFCEESSNFQSYIESGSEINPEEKAVMLSEVN